MPISNPSSREHGLRRVGFATRAVAIGAIALTGGFVALAAQASSGTAATTRPLSQTATLPQGQRDSSGSSDSGSGGYADPGYHAPAPSRSYAPPVTSSGGS